MSMHRSRTSLAIFATLVAAIATARADTLTLREGGLLEGRYAGGTGDVVQFTVGGQTQYFPVGVIAQLVLSPRGIPEEADAGGGAAPALPEAVAANGTVTLRLRDGSVFKGVYRGGTGDAAYFQALGSVKSFPVGEVASIEFVPPPPLPPPAAPSPAPAPPAAASTAAPAASSQAAGTAPAPKKLFFGGGVGFGYGDISWFEVWPVLGYRVAPKLTAGVEFLYRVREDNRYAKDINSTDYGVAPFVRLNLVRGLFVQAEYEYLSYEFVDAGLSTDRDDYDSVLLGVGLSRPMGGHAAFVVSAFYNFSYSDDDLYSPYDEAWIVNAGVGFGF